MQHHPRLQISLLLMRLTVFLVMLMWTLDKFFVPEHAARVFETFYFLPAFGAEIMRVIAIVELVILIGFVVGFAKFWTYGAVLVFHTVSTLTPLLRYFDPFNNLLFFAAWPMLAACIALFLLRDEDTKFAVD